MSKTYEDKIEASHPATLDTDEAYNADSVAMMLVGERDGKRELVDLVRWLILDNAKTIKPLPDSKEQGWQDIENAPSEPGYYWWLPVCFADKRKDPRYWIIISWHPRDTERQKLGTFVGPLPLIVQCQKKHSAQRSKRTGAEVSGRKPGGITMREELNTYCAVCGMPSTPKEYHPFAACLMFQACHNSETVKANLNAVIEHGNTRTEKKWKYVTVEDLRVGIYLPDTIIPDYLLEKIFNAARERKE